MKEAHHWSEIDEERRSAAVGAMWGGGGWPPVFLFVSVLFFFVSFFSVLFFFPLLFCWCDRFRGTGRVCFALLWLVRWGYGSNLIHQGTAGFSPCFHLPGQAILGTYF